MHRAQNILIIAGAMLAGVLAYLILFAVQLWMLVIAGIILYFLLRNKKLGKRLAPLINPAISGAIIFFSLSVCEIYLRMDGSLESYGEKNGNEYTSPFILTENGWLHVYKPYKKDKNDKKEFTHYLATNKLGLNDIDHALKSDSAVRIAVLGDSFTEGLGATGDSAYFKLLQKLLQHTEVMGCGISGSDPVFAYKLLQQKLLDYHPDIVTVTINSTDIGDLMVRGGFERFQPGGKLRFNKAPWWEFFFANSFIVRHIVLNGCHKDYLFMTPQQRIANESVAVNTLKSAVDSFSVLCMANKTRCIFIFHPMPDEIKKGKMDCGSVMHYAEDKGYEVVDLLSYFKAHGITGANIYRYYWPIDGHNNNAGYALFALAVKEQLDKLKTDTSMANESETIIHR